MGVTTSAETRPASIKVIESVADRKGVEPTGLDVPLFEVIDPDALDSFIRTAIEGKNDEPARVRFTYCGYDVVVVADGTVRIRGER